MAIATKRRIETQEDCPRFNDCEAPLCPLDKISLRAGIWYSDQEICKSQKFASLRWIKRQKRIVKRGISPDRLFTVSMLESSRRIQRGTSELNPELTLEESPKQKEEK